MSGQKIVMPPKEESFEEACRSLRLSVRRQLAPLRRAVTRPRRDRAKECPRGMGTDQHLL